MKELIEAISQDQYLVARILKLINSGYYGLRKTIDTVDRAVNLLGILKVKQVVYSASIMDIFSKEEEKEWAHAYSSSVLMSSIMEEHEIPAASNLPLTILMHDIGKVILRRFTPKKYRMAQELAEHEKLSISVAEDRVIHINHAEAGGWLLEKWQMTEDIYKPVQNHHCQEVPSEYVLETALLQFVNWVDCSARNIPCPPPSTEIMKEAGFEEIDVDYWINYQKQLILDIESKTNKDQENREQAPAPDKTNRMIDEKTPQAALKKTSTEKINRSAVIQQQEPPPPPPAPEQPMVSETSTARIDRSELKKAITSKEKALPSDAPKKKKGVLDSIFSLFKS